MRKQTLLKAFSLERVGLLMRNRLLDDLTALLIGLAVVAGFNVLCLILRQPALFNASSGRAGESAWSMAIALGGVLLAGRAFHQMHDGRGGSDWILLPATPLEKYVAAFASYAVAYPILASVAAFALSAVLEGLTLVLGAPRSGIFNPIAGLSYEDFEAYLIFTSFALAASARFAKLPLVKTAAIAMGWGIAYALVGTLGLLLLTPEGRAVLVDYHTPVNLHFGPGHPDEPVLGWILRVSVWMSFFFAVAYGYLRVSEKEAVDEVQ